jgi:hypothetical protein
MIDNALIPAPTTRSFAADRVRPTTDTPSASSQFGAFRISCKYSHMAYDDPIIFPGQPGRSHLHTFFGNTTTNANSTPESLVAAGNSTCTGGTINRSAYWIPSLINTANGAPLAPTDAIFYYKGDTPSAQIQAMPNGLRMFVGDPTSSNPPPQFSSPYRFHCERPDFSSYSYGFTIPDCASGDSVFVEVWFPTCWNGRDLDSADHKSHMSYSMHNACPTSHPVALPQITFNISWRMPAGVRGSQMRLSSDVYASNLPAGYSMHGDWLMGWKPEIRDAWTNNCLRTGRDCAAHLLGDGREIYAD